MNTKHLVLLGFLMIGWVAGTTQQSVMNNDAFYDSTCGQYRCSLAEMRVVDYVKSRAFGDYNCRSVIIQFNPDGTFNSTFEVLATLSTYYNASTGSIDSLYNPGTPILIKEYCDGKGNTCIAIDNFPYYVESIDQNTGTKRSSWRAIGMYDTNLHRDLKAMQVFHLTNFGDVLLRTDLNDDHGFQQAIFQTCHSI